MTARPLIPALILVFLSLFSASFVRAQHAFLQPAADLVVQRGAGGRANVGFRLAAATMPATVSLTPVSPTPGENWRRIALPAGETEGRFTDVPAGLYALCLEGRPDDCRRVGVGELFLVAGQSNAVSPTLPDAPQASRTGWVAVTAHHGDRPGYADKQPDSETMRFADKAHPTSVGICWLRLGDMLVERYGLPVGFVIVARSGVNSDCWDPARTACWPLMAKALSARRYRAVLWHQGESDVVDAFTMGHSLANLRDVVAASRKIRPGIPWIMARNSLNTATPYAAQPVRLAQETLIRSGEVAPGPDTDVLRDHPAWIREADFVGEGLQRHGELWFPPVCALLDAVGGPTSEPAP